MAPPEAPGEFPGIPAGDPRKTLTEQREGRVGVGVGVEEGEGGALGEGVPLGVEPVLGV